MSDIVVTVPKTFTHPASPGAKGLAAWVGEGDAAGDPWSGQFWVFSVYGRPPDIEPGERVYIVCEARLRGYAPLHEMRRDYYNGRVELIRGGGAVAKTLTEPIKGFRGWRYRWWDLDQEVDFPEWQKPGALAKRAGQPSVF